MAQCTILINQFNYFWQTYYLADSYVRNSVTTLQSSNEPWLLNSAGCPIAELTLVIVTPSVNFP